MSQASQHINRVNHGKKKKRRRKVVETISKPNRVDVEQWVAFMATCGYQLNDAGIRPSTVQEGYWSAKVEKWETSK